jgi:hypothetical protein
MNITNKNYELQRGGRRVLDRYCHCYRPLHADNGAGEGGRGIRHCALLVNWVVSEVSGIGIHRAGSFGGGVRYPGAACATANKENYPADEKKR